MRRLAPVLAVLALTALAAPAPRALAGSTAPAKPVAAPVAPEVPPGFVIHPEFAMSDGKTYPAGTAFTLDVNGERVIVTAHSLFGPMGGMPAQLTPEQLVAGLKEAFLYDAYTRDSLGKAGPALLFPGARPTANDAGGDVAVIRITSSLASAIVSSARVTLQGRELAAKDPKVGDPVWLAAALVGGTDTTPRAHLATVGEVDPGWMFFDYAESNLNLAATPGAPILDAQGHIVGLNIGGGARDGKQFGSAVPLSALRTAVNAALASAAPR